MTDALDGVRDHWSTRHLHWVFEAASADFSSGQTPDNA